MSDEVERVLRAHLGAADFICPYARAADKIFFKDVTAETIGRFVAAVRERAVAVVLADASLRDHDQAGDWCRATFLCLRALAGGGDDLHLREPKFLPYLDVGGATFHTIGMGPQYPRTHPRRAPHLCLVSVNLGAINEVTEREREAIRREAARRTGVVYDADEVWLPVHPQAREFSR